MLLVQLLDHEGKENEAQENTIRNMVDHMGWRLLFAKRVTRWAVQKNFILGAQMSLKVSKNPIKNPSKNLPKSYIDVYHMLALFWIPFGALGPPFWLQKSSWEPPWSSLGRQMLPIRSQTQFLESFEPILDKIWTNVGQMLDQFGDNVFQGRSIEVHIGTLLADQAFTFTDWTAEMKAKASICISNDETLIESLEISKSRIQVMIDKGMDNEKGVLQKLFAPVAGVRP